MGIRYYLALQDTQAEMNVKSSEPKMVGATGVEPVTLAL